jgi:2-polyprenyl-6-methoxyphenol hydroxylase-like FAD-dependent oxidoreductase
MARHEPILIVGGGLGGLTTALALSRRGVRARVLEGAPQFGAIGYGIQFGPNVFEILPVVLFFSRGSVPTRSDIIV